MTLKSTRYCSSTREERNACLSLTNTLLTQSQTTVSALLTKKLGLSQVETILANELSKLRQQLHVLDNCFKDDDRPCERGDWFGTTQDFELRILFEEAHNELLAAIEALEAFVPPGAHLQVVKGKKE